LGVFEHKAKHQTASGTQSGWTRDISAGPLPYGSYSYVISKKPDNIVDHGARQLALLQMQFQMNKMRNTRWEPSPCGPREQKLKGL